MKGTHLWKRPRPYSSPAPVAQARAQGGSLSIQFNFKLDEKHAKLPQRHAISKLDVDPGIDSEAETPQEAARTRLVVCCPATSLCFCRMKVVPYLSALLPSAVQAVHE